MSPGKYLIETGMLLAMLSIAKKAKEKAKLIGKPIKYSSAYAIKHLEVLSEIEDTLNLLNLINSNVNSVSYKNVSIVSFFYKECNSRFIS